MKTPITDNNEMSPYDFVGLNIPRCVDAEVSRNIERKLQEESRRLDWMLNATDDELNDLPEWSRQAIDEAILSNTKVSHRAEVGAPLSGSGLPPHLRDDANYLQCSKCRRKSWGGECVNAKCGMPSPSGEICDGILLGQNGVIYGTS